MLYIKDVFEVWQTDSLFKLIDQGKLLHENDGLVFTVNDCPYYAGTCQEIVKWKPSHMNTIDFRAKNHHDDVWSLCTV